MGLSKVEARGLCLNWLMPWYEVLMLNRSCWAKLQAFGFPAMEVRKPGITSQLPLEVPFTSRWQAAAALLGAALGIQGLGYRTPYIPGPRCAKITLETCVRYYVCVDYVCLCIRTFAYLRLSLLLPNSLTHMHACSTTKSDGI